MYRTSAKTTEIDDEYRVSKSSGRNNKTIKGKGKISDFQLLPTRQTPQAIVLHKQTVAIQGSHDTFLKALSYISSIRSLLMPPDRCSVTGQLHRAKTTGALSATLLTSMGQGPVPHSR